MATPFPPIGIDRASTFVRPRGEATHLFAPDDPSTARADRAARGAGRRSAGFGREAAGPDRDLGEGERSGTERPAGRDASARARSRTEVERTTAGASGHVVVVACGRADGRRAATLALSRLRREALRADRRARAHGDRPAGEDRAGDHEVPPRAPLLRSVQENGPCSACAGRAAARSLRDPALVADRRVEDPAWDALHQDSRAARGGLLDRDPAQHAAGDGGAGGTLALAGASSPA